MSTTMMMTPYHYPPRVVTAFILFIQRPNLRTIFLCSCILGAITTTTTIIIAIVVDVVVVAMAAMALSDRSGGRPRFLGVGDDTIAYIVWLEADDRRLCAGVVDGTAKLVAELAVDDDKSIMEMR
jgi:hypothetical protein